MSSSIVALMIALAPQGVPAGTADAVRAAGEAAAPDLAPAVEAAVERELWLMGSRARLHLTGVDRTALVRRTEVAIDELVEWESRISTWDPASDFSRINRARADRPVQVDAQAARLLSEVMQWAGVTGGAFDPAVGALVEAWGLRDGGRVPREPELAEWRRSRRELDIDLENCTVRRTVDAALIDAGAFGKGAALRVVAAGLTAAASVERAFVDLGGQLWVKAPPSDPWIVRVAHPAHRDRSVGTLRLDHGSVATSGSSERSVVVDGERYGHILDPRTGRPAPAWGSVTVVADDPLEADVLATALFVMGPEEGPRWIADHRPTLAALFLEDRPDGLAASWTGPLEAHLDRLDEHVKTSETVKTHEPKPRGFDDE